MSTPSIRKYIEAQGGSVHDTHDGLAVDFPAPTTSAATEVEAAVARAVAFGTRCLPLWRERGTGWYVAESHEEHPGCWYVCQIDERTGQPVGCECIASHVCHHLGAAISGWRERHGWGANEAEVLAAWHESLDRIAAAKAEGVQQEKWT